MLLSSYALVSSPGTGAICRSRCRQGCCCIASSLDAANLLLQLGAGPVLGGGYPDRVDEGVSYRCRHNAHKHCSLVLRFVAAGRCNSGCACSPNTPVMLLHSSQYSFTVAFQCCGEVALKVTSFQEEL